MINSGIYMILNELRGKAYIGSSINVYKRWSYHKYQLNRGTHTNPMLQNSWNKYKENNFKWAFIEPVSDIDILFKREQLWMDLMKPQLNIIRKIRENKKRHRPNEVKERMSEFMRGNQYAKGKKPFLHKKLKIEFQKN